MFNLANSIMKKGCRESSDDHTNNKIAHKNKIRSSSQTLRRFAPVATGRYSLLFFFDSERPSRAVLRIYPSS